MHRTRIALALATACAFARVVAGEESRLRARLHTNHAWSIGAVIHTV